MSEREPIPDYWIPLGKIETSSYNKNGGTFLDPTGSGLTLIRHRSEGTNDVIRLYDTEVPDLIHRLVDYETDRLTDK